MLHFLSIMDIDKGLYSRKQQILIAGAKLFHKKGFKGTTLQAIAQEIGIEGPSLYNHIKSKNEILSTLLLSNAQEFYDRMLEIKSTSETALQKLERLISLHIELTLKNPNAMALMLNEWVHLDAEDKTKYVNLRDSYDNDFQGILAQSIAEGDVADLEIDLMRFMMLSSLRSLYAWCAKYKNFNRVELEVTVKSVILNGILKK
ncbi:MAG: TetR family transcriptional regulator [Crocinitomicaceae bacterium]|nr:TetR family transcriptional regulator [Crocinitomicaceae bacterium]